MPAPAVAVAAGVGEPLDDVVALDAAPEVDGETVVPDEHAASSSAHAAATLARAARVVIDPPS
jgi:hypothetical protein